MEEKFGKKEIQREKWKREEKVILQVVCLT